MLKYPFVAGSDGEIAVNGGGRPLEAYQSDCHTRML